MVGNWTKDSVADLATIDAAALVEAGASAEKQKLLQAAQISGLFDLRLSSTLDGREILSILPEIYRISDVYFAQPMEVKEKDQRLDQESNQDRGFKSSDCDETFEFSIDEIRQKTLKLPTALQEYRVTIERFCELCHKVCHDVLQTISAGLGDRENKLQEQHVGKSDSGLKLISEPALAKLSDVGDNTHTDGGTLTMIFTEKWGILAKEKDTDQWAFTKPVEGCALFNVADSLQRMTNRQVYSPTHRVTQREDGAEPRTFLSYYLRPDRVTH